MSIILLLLNVDEYICFWQIKYIILEDESIAKLLSILNRDSWIVNYIRLCVCLFVWSYEWEYGFDLCSSRSATVHERGCERTCIFFNETLGLQSQR